MKNQPFKIDVLKSINCSASSSFKLTWEYFKGYYYDELFTVPSIKSVDQSTLHIKSGSFPYGVLKICAIVQMKVSKLFIPFVWALPCWYKTLFWLRFNVFWKFWTSDGRLINAVCLLGNHGVLFFITYCNIIKQIYEPFVICFHNQIVSRNKHLQLIF